MFKSLKKIFLFSLLSLSLFAYSNNASAELDPNLLDNIKVNNGAGVVVKTTKTDIAAKANYSTTPAMDIAKKVVTVILGLCSTVALVMVMLAGYEYLMSKGDSTKIKTATNKIVTGFIGIALIIFSYAITNFILQQLIIRNIK